MRDALPGTTTAISSWPERPANATARRTLSPTKASQQMYRTIRPSPASAAAAFASLLCVRPAMVTVAPSRDSSRADPSPIPLPPPTTSACFPPRGGCASCGAGEVTSVTNRIRRRRDQTGPGLRIGSRRAGKPRRARSGSSCRARPGGSRSSRRRSSPRTCRGTCRASN